MNTLMLDRNCPIAWAIKSRYGVFVPLIRPRTLRRCKGQPRKDIFAPLLRCFLQANHRETLAELKHLILESALKCCVVSLVSFTTMIFVKLDADIVGHKL